MLKLIVSSIWTFALMLKSLALTLAVALPIPAMAEPYLLMAEEVGCIWCAKWNEEVGYIYPKTAEGRAAPLKRYDLQSETPDVVFERRSSGAVLESFHRGLRVLLSAESLKRTTARI